MRHPTLVVSGPAPLPPPPSDRPESPLRLSTDARTDEASATGVPLPRVLIAALLTALGPALLFLLPPLRQNTGYHAFADARSWLGLPNALDVLTNLPFLLAGLFGLREALHRPATPVRHAWIAFFAGVTLVAFGSGWYHLAPTNASLVWDRLPMTVAFTSLFAAVLGETIAPRLARRTLLPAILGGVASVFWWQQRDDLRPYFAVQLLALVGVPVLLALFRQRGEHRNWLVAGLGCYALAFAAEHSDTVLFGLTGGAFSGHSLKHGLAALACACVAAMLRARRLAPGQHIG